MTGVIYALPSVLLLLKSGFRPQWISNVTQVPSIFGLVEDFYSNPYPCTRGTQQSFERFSFAPMVIATGTMMAFEALRVLLKKDTIPLYKGYFFNPWKVQIERPAPFWLLPFRMFRAYLFFKKMFG